MMYVKKQMSKGIHNEYSKIHWTNNELYTDNEQNKCSEEFDAT